MAVLTISQFSFRYPNAAADILTDISCTLEAGEFVVLCGETGCGKTTLLRSLKRELAPRGETRGVICLHETPIRALDARTAAAKIGFVLQNPEQQIVTDKVWHELAFGLENLGVSPNIMRRRCAEMAAYFGISEWYTRDTASLSGGQKQLLSLAAIMAMQPDVLLLDEPTAQLDPIAAGEFLAAVHRLSRDFSLTVLLSEHRLEAVIPRADRLLILEHGRLTANAAPREVLAELPADAKLLLGMPAAVRISRMTRTNAPDGSCPLTVAEGRRYLLPQFRHDITALPTPPPRLNTSIALEWRHAYARYDRKGVDILCDLTLRIPEGCLYCLLGGNGAGKSTALRTASGLLRCYAGTLRVLGKSIETYPIGALYQAGVAMLPQDVQTLFCYNSVREELVAHNAALQTNMYDFTPYLETHPYDLSGGQQQLLALTLVLARTPRILLLDEPTKGLDAETKARFGVILHTLRDAGMTILCVTHDVEFAAQYADRCGMLFRGELVSEDAPAPFFTENAFYTTAAARMTRGIYENAVTVEDVATLCLQNGKIEPTEVPPPCG